MYVQIINTQQVHVSLIDAKESSTGWNKLCTWYQIMVEVHFAMITDY